MQLTLDQLFASPDFNLFAFEDTKATFLRMNEPAYRRSIFVDGRILPADPRPFAVPIAPLLQFHRERNPTAVRTGWIFHMAQCGSTLLARALDRPDRNLVLREPLPLRQLGAARARSKNPDACWQEQLCLATFFAGRRYRPDLPTIVKANVPVNCALLDIVDLDRTAPAIFLYFPLETYLLAILRSTGHRQWLRRVTEELGPALQAVAGDVAALDDAARGAALWLFQTRNFLAAMERLDMSHSLDAETLFNDPIPVLARGGELFGQPFDRAELDAVVSGPLFATYSKNPLHAFDNVARLKRQEETRSSLRPELDAARGWLAGRLAEHPIPERLPRPLTGTAPALLA